PVRSRFPAASAVGVRRLSAAGGPHALDPWRRHRERLRNGVDLPPLLQSCLWQLAGALSRGHEMRQLERNGDHSWPRSDPNWKGHEMRVDKPTHATYRVVHSCHKNV